MEIYSWLSRWLSNLPGYLDHIFGGNLTKLITMVKKPMNASGLMQDISSRLPIHSASRFETALHMCRQTVRPGPGAKRQSGGGLYGARLLDGQLFLELLLPFVQFCLTVTCRLQGQSRHLFMAPAKLQPPIDWISLVQGENRLCFQFATRSANLGLCVSQRRSTAAVRDLQGFTKKQYWQVMTTVIFRAFDSLSSHHARRRSS